MKTLLVCVMLTATACAPAVAFGPLALSCAPSCAPSCTPHGVSHGPFGDQPYATSNAPPTEPVDPLLPPTADGVASAPVTSPGSPTGRLVPVALAATNTQPTPRLSVSMAVAAALGNHPQLRAAQAAVRRRQHLMFQATRPPNPTVGYLAAEVGNDGDAGQQGVFVSQEVVRGDKLTLAGQVRYQEVLLEKERLRLEQLQIEADVRYACIEVAYTQEQLRLLQRLQQSLDTAASAVTTLVRSGELGGPAALQSRLEAQRNLMKTQQTDAALNTARQSLAAVVGWKSFNAIVENQVLRSDPLGEDTSPAALWDRIRTSSPQIAVVYAQQQIARARVCREQAEPIPNLQTQWSLQQDASTDHTVLGIQLGVELPIRDRNRGAISAAQADSWRFHHQAQAVQRDLKTRYVQLSGQAQQARLQLTTIEDQLEKLALQNVSTTQQAFQLGEATYLDLLNAQRAYISLSLEKLELYRQLSLIHAACDTQLVRPPSGL